MILRKQRPGESPLSIHNTAQLTVTDDALTQFSAIPDTASIGAERNADYFSIGHLSDTLLKALQDPEFHARMEKEAQQQLTNTDMESSESQDTAEI